MPPNMINGVCNDLFSSRSGRWFVSFWSEQVWSRKTIFNNYFQQIISGFLAGRDFELKLL